MRLYCKLLAIVLACVCIQVKGQDIYQEVDSFKQVAFEEKNDTNRLSLFIIISDRFCVLNDIDSALFYAKQCLDLSGRMKWEKGKCHAYNQYGYVYTEFTKYDTAMIIYERSLAGYKKLKDTAMMGEVYANIGVVYEEMGKYSQSLENYFKSLSIHEQLEDKDSELTNYTNIGNVYGAVGEREKSRMYYEKALELNKELGYDYDEALIYLNIGVECATAEPPKTDSALYFNNKALKILEELGEDMLVGHTWSNNAGIYMEKGDYNKVMELLNKAGEIFTLYEDKQYLVENSHAKGTAHYLVAIDTTGYNLDTKYYPISKKANLLKAIQYLEQAKKVYDDGEVTGIVHTSELYDELYQAYEENGQIKKAFEIYKDYNVLMDSMLAQEDDKKIAQLEGQRALDVKNKELELQKLIVVKERNERWFLIGGIALLLVGLGVIFYNYRQRGKTNKLLAEEKHKSEELLLNILPEEVADELKEKGSAGATHFDEVTVLFTDFVNFTKAGERMTSQELVDELHACFKAFDEITSKYHIEKIKTIGDAYLAVSGLPAADAKHAENVVNAAIEILHFMKERRKQLGDKTFEIRIGVHSGDVVAGIVGVKKFAYDIWGDTVNTASRMESSSEAGYINISQTTYERVQGKFTCTYRGELDAKNKGKLKMYFVHA